MNIFDVLWSVVEHFGSISDLGLGIGVWNMHTSVIYLCEHNL
jgi:hypothetical protein